MRSPFIILLILNQSYTALAQTPTVNFDAPGTTCLESQFELTNNTMDADEYLWDFCEGDLIQTPTLSGSISLPSSPVFGVTFLEEGGNWYGFAVSFTNVLMRLDFGSSLENDPTIVDLGNPGDLLNGGYSVKLIREGTDWYGLVTNFSNSRLIRLSFGNSIENPPSAEQVTINISVLFSPRGLDIAEDNGNFYAIIGNFTSNNIAFLSFGTSITNMATATTISAGAAQLGVNFERHESNWYSFVLGNNLQKIDFGTSLSTMSPPINEVVLDQSIIDGSNIVIDEDGGNYYGILASRSGSIYRLDLGADLSTLTSSVTDLGDFSMFTDVIGFSGVEENNGYTLYAINTNSSEPQRILFRNDCGESIKSSSEFEPQGLTYGSSGQHSISLYATNQTSGITASKTQQITITSETAPDIDFTFDQCIAVPTQFTSSNTSNNIDTYSWDFGDGSPITNDPNPTHDYGATMGVGSYDVILSVESTEGCTNFTQQTIEIFNEPTPDFTFPGGSLCSGEPIAFTNATTNIPGTPGVISYLWDFNGEGTSTEENPSFTFQSGGSKTVTLTSSIPGCAPSVQMNINILEGPSVDFSFNNICLGDEATFTDLTTGSGIDPDSYLWDFGDGGTSTLINASHFYNSPGDFNVSLSVANTNCTIVDIQTITVHALPVANFVNDQACIGPVQFNDATTVQSANVIEWQWDFGNGEFSVEQNPIVQYAENADFTVQLTTTSNFGCVDDVSKTVSVLSAPTPQFTVSQGCLGEPTSFNDQTIIGDINPVTSYFWEIEDKIYSEMNPKHTFTTAGTFSASMTITTANTCTVIATNEIVIPPLPIPDFSSTNACANSVITFEDQSLDEGDPIISRTWDFDGLATANGSITQFTFTEPGNYNVGLTTRSTLGCTAFVGKTIQVNEQPIASFSASSTFGPPPLSVNFTNQSEGGASYAWVSNDSVDPFSTDEHAALIFEEEGDFEISLVTFNEFGCTDTLKQVIEVAFPAVDLVLDEVIAAETNGRTNIVLRGANRGTLPIEGFDILINLDGVPFVQTFSQTLLKGQPFVHTLDFQLLANSNVELLCVNLQLIDIEELNTDNNLGCINFESKIIVQDPFPNPVVQTVRLRMILPEVNDDVQISLMNVHGEVLIDRSFDDLVTGLNIFDFDVQQYESGLYLVRVIYDGTEEVRRIRKE